jgi:hypothetical protein
MAASREEKEREKAELAEQKAYRIKLVELLKAALRQLSAEVLEAEVRSRTLSLTLTLTLTLTLYLTHLNCVCCRVACRWAPSATSTR